VARQGQRKSNTSLTQFGKKNNVKHYLFTYWTLNLLLTNLLIQLIGNDFPDYRAVKM